MEIRPKSEEKGDRRMKTKRTKTICPEKTEFAILTICHELNLRDVLSKMHKMFCNSYDKVWWDLKEITTTDFTAESVYNLTNFIKDHQDSYPKGMVVVVADTEMSYVIARTTLSLLRLDGFEGHAQIFSSRKAALQWVKLADLLHSS